MPLYVEGELSGSLFVRKVFHLLNDHEPKYRTVTTKPTWRQVETCYLYKYFRLLQYFTFYGWIIIAFTATKAHIPDHRD